MASPRPDHIAPPPGVLRRVLLGYLIAVVLLFISYGLVMVETSRRAAALWAEVEQDAAVHFPPTCCAATHIPYEQSATFLLDQALAAMADPNARLMSDRPSKARKWEAPLPQKAAAFVAANATALDYLHRAGRSTYCGLKPGEQEPPGRWRAPQLASIVRAAHISGDDALAIRIVVDVLRADRTTSQHAGSVLSFEMFDVLGEFAHELRITDESRATTVTAISLLLDDTTLHRSSQSWLAMFHDFIDARAFCDAYGDFGPPPAWYWWPTSRLALLHFARDVSNSIRAIRLDNHPAALTFYRATRPGIAHKLDPDWFVETLEGNLNSHYSKVGQRRVAAIILAQRLYEFDHGHPATTQSELAPDYLQPLPGDPFRADGGSFIQPVPDQPWILQSVGPHGAAPTTLFGLKGPPGGGKPPPLLHPAP